MRRPRIRAEGASYYHCMSRIIERRHIMGDREKHAIALGGRDFVDKVFRRYPGHFGPKRTDGARAMRFADWGGLFTLRDLRLDPVTRP